jgi:ABC-type Fe3+-hydroxamate transport system substrate-binding protein
MKKRFLRFTFVFLTGVCAPGFTMASAQSLVLVAGDSNRYPADTVISKALRGMIQKCWTTPAIGVDKPGSQKITIKFSLNQSGEVEGKPQVIAGLGNSAIERAAAKAALRAVVKCSPYDLPKDKYDAWSEVVVNFDPSELF